MATPDATPAGPSRGTVLVGTFNEPGDLGPALPSSGGIVRTTGWPDAPEAVAGSGPDAPSWLVRGRPGTPSDGRLYAALHLREGALAVLSPAGDAGRPAGADPSGPRAQAGTDAVHDVGWVTSQQVPAGGANTCHADLNPSGTWLAAASYDSGTLTIAAVLDDGRLDTPIAVQAPAGSGPIASRQESPHLHFVLFLDDDRLLVSDLGADRILEYSIAAILEATSMASSSPDEEAAGTAGVVESEAGPLAGHCLPAGTGPRHLAVLPPLPGSGRPGAHLAVVGELDSRLHILDLDAGPEGFPEAGVVATHAQDADPQSARDNLPSHVVLSADERLLYVANRGRNTIAVIRRAPRPEFIAEVPCGGAWPRHIALADLAGEPGLLVALERDDAVVVLPLDEGGIPQSPAGRVAVRRPGFLLPED